MNPPQQQAVITLSREDQARALSQSVAFLGLFVQPSSPSDVAPRLGMAANLAHHHARRLAELGLLFEQRREHRRVYYQLAAREFRHAHDLLPPGDPDENVAASLHALTHQFLAAHTRSWRAAEGEGEQGPTIYGFLDPSAEGPLPPPPTGPATEAHPAHFDALSVYSRPSATAGWPATSPAFWTR